MAPVAHEILGAEINLAAYRFYSRHGFSLRTARHCESSEYPDEIQLLWYMNLAKHSRRLTN